MKRLTYILFLTAFISSCVETIEPKLDEKYEAELVVNSVVIPGEPVEFFLSTSVPIESNLTPFHPVNEEAEVRLKDQYGEVVVEYVPSELVWRTSRVYDPRPGYVFELEVELLEKDHSHISPIKSTTYVPQPVNILEYDHISNENLMSNGENVYNHTLNLAIESSDEDIHYRLVARDINTNEELPVISVSIGTDATTRLAHMEGIMINSNSLTDGEFEYTIQSDRDRSHVRLDLYTVNDEYYRYNVSLSNAYGSNNSPFDEPIARYTNIEQGLGLFGSYSLSNKVCELK